MTDTQQAPFDFAIDDRLAGFRLHRLEVLNWGTFDKRIWRFDLNGRNALLTGNIGSGKSTLVDAITTLLVPTQRIVYNKAAGSESRERSLRSYVTGHYKSERSETTGSSKSISLRDSQDYTVILGIFCNEGYLQTITLAQVFWTKKEQPQPERFFVCAEKELSIKENFSNFGTDILQLRRNLRQIGAEVENSFSRYAAWFRRRFGIDNEQALDLFLQTVSMKSVDNITDFVRENMLSRFYAAERIQVLITHFEDLNDSHQAVLKAELQIKILTPLIEDIVTYKIKNLANQKYKIYRKLLQGYFAHKKFLLLQEQVICEEQLLTDNNLALASQENLRSTQQKHLENIKQAIHANGGDRLEHLATEIKREEKNYEVRKKNSDQYAALVEALGEKAATSEGDFQTLTKHLKKQKEEWRKQEIWLSKDLTDQSVAFREEQSRHTDITNELESLKKRQSNIGDRQIQMRTMLCNSLNLSVNELPFAGELIRVRDDSKEWEGAAERLLHNFALSLLVPDHLYSQVVEWVERTHLKGRLVYYRIQEPRLGTRSPRHSGTLAHKLEIHPDSTMYSWVENELFHRFSFTCCENQDDFKRSSKAVTRAGQVKEPNGRHEKDDRHRIDDKSRYVLGWNNTAKISAFEEQQAQQEALLQKCAESITQAQTARSVLQTRFEILARLEVFNEYSLLDYKSAAEKAASLMNERNTLTASSDILRELRIQQEATEAELKNVEQAYMLLFRKQGLLEHALENLRAELTRCEQVLEHYNPTDEQVHELMQLHSEHVLGDLTQLASYTEAETTLRNILDKKIENLERILNELREDISSVMRDFVAMYPLEGQDLGSRFDAYESYCSLFEQLNKDDLPRFVERFKKLLTVNTINEIANFSAHLFRECATIEERLDIINTSLTQIDYNPDRYIRLEAHKTDDSEIRNFQAALKACTEGAVSADENEQYSEARFIHVKNIIERFRGREGRTELDRRWTEKVTDVRNWFSFAASERWRADKTEFDHYTDSGGKSGGQKEKLAYTILAASLAYQFGLEWGEVRSRSFRFVVIDEAFGRGSDDSTQYGLNLFQKLNMQLLIITPLQKIHIIEPYVSSVGFVDNPTGNYSRLRVLSIEEHYTLKAKNAVNTTGPDES